MVDPVNAPLGFLQAETYTNISIITEKPGDCQAQSRGVADNMFELLVVKVSRCSSNMDKKPLCHFQRFQPHAGVFSRASFFLHSQDKIMSEECESCFFPAVHRSVFTCR